MEVAVLKVPDVVGDRVRSVVNQAKKDLSEHQVTMRLNNGLWRSWRCQRPGSWVYGFDVTTGPGWIMVTGDMGTCVWERTADMIDWAEASINSLSYFAEKVPREIKIKEYDPDKAKAWLLGEIVDYFNDHCGSDDHGGMDDKQWTHWHRLLTLYRHEDPSDQMEFAQAIHKSGVADGSDWPNFYNYTYHFLWIREGLKWFFAHKDQAVEVAA
jgi:hypothetical protein